MTTLYENHPVDYIYGVICFVCVLVGVPGNMFSFHHFLTKKRDVASILYTGVTFVDILISLLPIPVGISYFKNREAALFTSTLFCNIWAVSFLVLKTLSIWYSTILSMVRSYCLLRPFNYIPKALVIGIMLMCLVLSIVPPSIVYWEKGGEWRYGASYVDCTDVYPGPTKKYWQTMNIIYWVTIISPFLPIVISTVMSIYTLSKTTGNGMSNTDNDKQYAAVTIAIFTLLYVIFNIPGIAIEFLNIVGTHITDTSHLLKFDTKGYFANFAYNLSLPLNAMCNPILYVTRMKKMRADLMRFFGQICNTVGLRGNNIAPVAQRPAGIPRIPAEDAREGGVRDKGCRSLSLVTIVPMCPDGKTIETKPAYGTVTQHYRFDQQGKETDPPTLSDVDNDEMEYTFPKNAGEGRK